MPKGRSPAPDDLQHRPSGAPITPASDGVIYCAAKKKNGDICKSIKIMPNGRCKFHGGMSTGRVNGTGLRQTIYKDMFTEDEVAYLEETKETDIAKQLDDEIDIARVRERRMLKKINELKDKQWREIEKKETIGQHGNQVISNVETTSQSTEALIQKIEGDITKVQNQIMKLLNSKAQYLASISQDTQVDVSVFVNAVQQNTENLWEDDENGDNEENEG